MRPQTQLLLIGESFSPWTKKARWALEYCGLAYDYREYTPTLSEPGLRWRLRQWSGSVSVPVLFADQDVFRGSWEIARYSDKVTGDRRLGSLEKIKHWNELSEDALAEGRSRVVSSILNSNKALEEALPAFVPNLLRRPMRFIAYNAAQRLNRKYAHLVKPGSLHHALEQTRKALKKSGGDYLLGSFSYADITMAVVLEVIAPLASAEPPLGTETEKFWNDVALAKAYPDLVEWRNRLATNAATTYSQFIPDMKSS